MGGSGISEVRHPTQRSPLDQGQTRAWWGTEVSRVILIKGFCYQGYSEYLGDEVGGVNSLECGG